MPYFQAAYEEHGADVMVIGIDVGPYTGLGSIEDGLALIADMGVTFPAGSTPDGSAVSAYELGTMPSTFFITPSGEVLRHWTGGITKSRLEEQIRRLIKVSASPLEGR